MKKNIILGANYRDMVTGFTGIAVAVTDYLFACRRVSLQDQTIKDGKVGEWQVFDALQIVYVDAGISETINPPAPPEERPGGPGAVAPLPRGPERR